MKVRYAQKRGAKGILIYSDPGDDGYGRGDVYPNGPFRSGSSLQRGSVQFLSLGPGDPSTPKTSHKGIPVVYRDEFSTEEKPTYYIVQGGTPKQLDNCAYRKVYSNGNLLIEDTFDQIRKRVRA